MDTTGNWLGITGIFSIEAGMYLMGAPRAAAWTLIVSGVVFILAAVRD